MYPKVKIYNDGSHYVGIPHRISRPQKRVKLAEEVVEIKENNENDTVERQEEKECLSTYSPTFKQKEGNLTCDITQKTINELPLMNVLKENTVKPKKTKRTATRSQIFNELYENSKDMTRAKRKNFLIQGMRPYFESELQSEVYVKSALRRKYHNYLNRRRRFIRKANLNNFNYFVTFTYDDKLHTEESFKKKLRACLKNFQQRKEWRYMGIWERSPKARIHFHGLLKIPDGTMPGELIEKKDYNLNTKRMQTTMQNTFFNEKFGRSDFEVICDNPRAKAEAYAYILKYLEKTGEKIIYSRGLPLYVVADVDEEDILAFFDDESGRMVLYDKFICWDEGKVIGEMSEETKKGLRTANA